MRTMLFYAASAAAALLTNTALAASTTAAATAVPSPDQEMGRHFDIKAEDLPEPYAEKAVRNPAVTIERDGHVPNVPEAFAVNLFADKLEGPRQLLVLDNGDVLVAEQGAGKIMFLRDGDGDGKAETVSLFAQDFQEPYGMAVVPSGEHKGHILVADAQGIWRVPMQPDGMRAAGEEIYAPKAATDVPAGERKPEAPFDHFPVTAQGVFGEPGGHSTRSLVVDPKDGRMFVGVGSSGNVDVEPEPRATIQVFDADGKKQRTFASGTRNPIGLAFNPTTGALWAVVQERDGLGNRLVPDFFTEIKDGDFYGWPYAYTGGNPMPGFAKLAPDKVKQTKMPDLLFAAHSSSMDFVFYKGGEFPAEYNGDAFVALKGSWNRADPTGYKIVHVPFKDGKPEGGYNNFVTGFWVEGKDRAVVWGRPADIAETKDGALLIADETGGTIWRVSYVGEEPAATSSTKAEEKPAQ
jgi:glucose/arabinose dehydrogenase